MSEEWYEGYRAYCVSIKWNPYLHGDEVRQYLDWDAGWKTAQYDFAHEDSPA